MTTIITIDSETTANGPSNSPEAHYPDNKALMWGWKEGHQSVKVHPTSARLADRVDELLANKDDVVLVGHNIKFDLKYLMRDEPHVKWGDCRVFDTMYYQYRWSGHRDKFMGLEATCAAWNVPYVKTLDLGAWLKAGNLMEDIPTDDLEAYLEDDVGYTFSLYNKMTMDPRYYEHFTDHLSVLAAMELIGLDLDKTKTQHAMAAAIEDRDTLDQGIWDIVEEVIGWTSGDIMTKKQVNYTASRTMSYIFTGKPDHGLTPHLKRRQIKLLGKPLLSAKEISKLWGPNAKVTHLGYKMTAKELKWIKKHAKSTEAVLLADQLLDWKEVDKLIGTYYGPFLEEVKHTGGTLHPKLNTCATATGRLSSSNPNGQNMPLAARECIKSRYGCIYEIDFKQLEVVALAHLSQDQQLLDDLANGEDIHFNTGKRVMGWKVPADMTSAQRKLVKNVNFGLIYGGGASGLSEQTGQPKKLVQSLIDSFYTRYPGVAEWQKEFYTAVTDNMKTAGFQGNEQVYSSLYEDPTTGRRFFFKEHESPAWMKARTGRSYSFKPTETKNYPVQGFAGGDIVMWSLRLLWEVVREWPDTALRMTVHDSIMLDTAASPAIIEGTMDLVCSAVRHQLNIQPELKFELDVCGTHWR